jgi:hypothetical protein
MEREDGYAFDCRIPPFSLESKHEEKDKDPKPENPKGPENPNDPPPSKK